jgi:hypothetical protein
MKTFLLSIALLLLTSLATAAEPPAGPARLDGEWKLD